MKRYIYLLLLLLLFRSTSTAKITDLSQTGISEGLIHHRFVKHLPRGPIVINILEVDTSKGYLIKPALAQLGTIWGKATLRSISNREDAIAGINANYFSSGGMPIGALAIDGEWITGPVLNRATFSIDKKGQAHFANPSVTGRIKLKHPHERKANFILPSINNINQPFSLAPHGISFYNHWWEDKVRCGDGKACLLVDGRGIVRSKVKVSESVNPFYPTRSDYVLLSAQDQVFTEISIGDQLQVSWYSEPDWSGMHHVVGGGPYLIRDGRIILNEVSEGFSKRSGIGGAAPRTAVGVTSSSNRLIFLTADGRQKSSVGMTLWELASLLKEIGVREAINLDGGGSTTMLVKGRVVNHPSDRTGMRRVSTGLLLFRGGSQLSSINPGGP